VRLESGGAGRGGEVLFGGHANFPPQLEEGKVVSKVQL
jgi:hypothetical protein